MRKSLLSLSALVLSILMISPAFSQDKGRKNPNPPEKGGQAEPRRAPNPPQRGGGQERDKAEPRKQSPPSREGQAEPRRAPDSRQKGNAVPQPRYNEYQRRSYPRFGSYFDFRYHYPYPYYYPRYYPRQHEMICISGHWEYDRNGYTIWVTGYCNVPYHRHDSCYYYYDYCR